MGGNINGKHNDLTIAALKTKRFMLTWKHPPTLLSYLLSCLPNTVNVVREPVLASYNDNMHECGRMARAKAMFDFSLTIFRT